MLILFTSCDGALEPSSLYRKESSLDGCVYNLANRFKINHITIISNSSPIYNGNGSHFCPLDLSSLSRVRKDDRWTITTENVNRNDFKFRTYERPTGFIIVVDTRRQLNLVLKNLTKENRGHKFLVIFQTPLKNQAKMVTKTMKNFFNRNEVNFKIITPDPANITRYLVTYWVQFCDKPRQTLLAYCSFGNYHNKTSSVDDRISFSRCSLRATHTKHPPFTHEVAGGTEIVGIEENLINTIASLLHLTVVYNESRRRGSVYSNGSVTENYLLLQNGSADVLFGGYTLSEWRIKHFRHTIGYMEKVLSWCAPTNTIFGYDKAFEGVINFKMLMYLVGLHVGTSVVLWCISNLEEREISSYTNILNAFTNNFYILTGTSIRSLPRSRKMRLLMVLFSIVALILNTFYSSYLTSTLISARHTEKYEDLAEVYKDNLTVLTAPSIIKYFDSAETSFSFSVVADKILAKLGPCSNTTKCLLRVAEDNVVFFMCDVDRSYVFKKTKHLYEAKLHVYCSEQFVYKFLVAIYTRRDFPLLGAFNKIIGRIMSSGLIIKWKRDVVDEVKFHVHFESMIRMKHLMPVFKIFICALNLSVIVFLVELIIGRD